MNSKLLFLIGCIPARLLLVYISRNISIKYVYLFSLFLLGIAISFLYLYFANARLNAFEAGGKTWWYQFRILHGLLYLAAAIYGFQGKINYMWIPLTMDVILGFILFLNKHYL